MQDRPLALKFVGLCHSPAALDTPDQSCVAHKVHSAWPRDGRPFHLGGRRRAVLCPTSLDSVHKKPARKQRAWRRLSYDPGSGTDLNKEDLAAVSA